MTPDIKEAGHPPAPPLGWMGLVRRKIATLKYGHLTITVHDGRVVQVEQCEKVRFDVPGGSRAHR